MDYMEMLLIDTRAPECPVGVYRVTATRDNSLILKKLAALKSLWDYRFDVPLFGPVGIATDEDSLCVGIYNNDCLQSYRLVAAVLDGPNMDKKPFEVWLLRDQTGVSLQLPPHTALASKDAFVTWASEGVVLTGETDQAIRCVRLHGCDSSRRECFVPPVEQDKSLYGLTVGGALRL